MGSDDRGTLDEAKSPKCLWLFASSHLTGHDLGSGDRRSENRNKTYRFVNIPL